MLHRRKSLVCLLVPAVCAACDPRSYQVGAAAVDAAPAAVDTAPAAIDPTVPPVTPTPDARTALAPAPTPASACDFAAAPIPVRPLAIPASAVADRVTRFLGGPGPDPGALATTADVQRYVRVWYGDTSDRQHALAHASLHVLPFSTWWLGQTSNELIDAFIAGRGGLALLLEQPNGPAGEARAGFFSVPQVLAKFTRATARGMWIRQNLLCQAIPPSPPNVPGLPSAPRPGTTARQRLETATAEPVCVACHRLIDPPGFAFEHFDESGRYRATDNGLAVDTSATIVQLDGRDVQFGDPAGLMHVIAGSCAVHTCMAQKWLDFALRSTGRTLKDGDAPAIRELAAAFMASGDDLRELVVAVTQSPAFLAP